jgi:hypothetical protein
MEINEDAPVIIRDEIVYPSTDRDDLADPDER